MSTVFAVRARIAELLTSNPDLTDVQVNYGVPRNRDDLTGDSGVRSAVWLGDAQLAWDIVALGTPVYYDEQYTFEIITQCLGQTSADTQDVMDARASVILQALVDMLVADTTLGGLEVSGWIDIEVTLGTARVHTGYTAGSKSYNVRIEAMCQVRARRG
jgi:hypothetical protein